MSAQDIAIIATTPDIKDLLSPSGIKQVGITIGKLKPSDLPDLAEDTVEEYVKDVGWAALTPVGAPLEVAMQLKRMFG